MAMPEAPAGATAGAFEEPQAAVEGSLPPEDVHPSLDSLRRYISEWAKTRGYAFIKRRSTTNSSASGRLVVTFACDRSGMPRESIALKRRRKPTRMCGCSYSFMAKENADGTWSIRHRSHAKFSLHNHEPSSDPAEHPASRSLFPDEKAIVLDMAAVGITPKQILEFLQRRQSLATKRDIYNCLSAAKRKSAEGIEESIDASDSIPTEVLPHTDGLPTNAVSQTLLPAEALTTESLPSGPS